MPFGGLLTIGLISAGTKIAGGAIASKGAKSAAKTQADAAREARDYAQSRYGVAEQLTEPQRKVGQDALYTLANLISQSRPPSWGAGGISYGQSSSPYTVGSSFRLPSRSFDQGGMVTLRAPTGQTKSVPRAQAQMFINRGAQLVE